MFLFDFIIDLLLGIYTSLGFGTPERKINIKMDKIKGQYPDLTKLYYKDKGRFENDKILAKIILESPIKTNDQIDELAKKIYTYI